MQKLSVYHGFRDVHPYNNVENNINFNIVPANIVAQNDFEHSHNKIDNEICYLSRAASVISHNDHEDNHELHSNYEPAMQPAISHGDNSIIYNDQSITQEDIANSHVEQIGDAAFVEIYPTCDKYICDKHSNINDIDSSSIHSTITNGGLRCTPTFCNNNELQDTRNKKKSGNVKIFINNIFEPKCTEKQFLRF